MGTRWIKIFGLLILVIIFICVVAWSIVRISLGTTFSSTEFPLSEKWTTKLKGDIQQITVVNDRIIVARTKTEIFALEVMSGNILWQRKTARYLPYQPPLVKNGMLYLTDGKGILVLNQNDGKVLWQQPVRHPSLADIVDVNQDFVAVSDAPFLVMYQTKDGVFLWERDVCRGKVQGYLFDNSIVIPCFGLTVMNAFSGETIWEAKSEPNLNRIRKSAFADGAIYFSQDLENIVAYDVKNRKLLWQTPLVEDYHSFQAYNVMETYLFMTIDDQLCVLYREDGRSIWCTGNLVKPRNPTIIKDTLYLLCGLRKGITAYDLYDGSQIGRLDFPAYIFITEENDEQLMVASNELLIFASGKNIYAYGK